MEPAKIDWQKIEWSFVEEEVYERINAPTWVDFTASEEKVDDDAWFCRPDCNHPKTAEDFLISSPSQLSNSNRSPEVLPLGDRYQRVAKLKKRGLAESSISSKMNFKFNEDSENQNPNFSTPLSQNGKSMKMAIKSSTERKPLGYDVSQRNGAPILKTTLSARNMFPGRDIMNHITEFCNELKRMANRAREQENVDKLSAKNGVGSIKEEEEIKDCTSEVLVELEKAEKERKPSIELDKEKHEDIKNTDSVKQNQRRKKKFDRAENVLISLDLGILKHKSEASLQHIRTNPPTPQCFSRFRVPKRITPSKVAKPGSLERGILQEVEQNKKAAMEEATDESKTISLVDAKETRTLDLLWFLKPCTFAT